MLIFGRRCSTPLNVYDSFKLEVGCIYVSIVSEFIPASFDTLFSKRSDIHDYYTRNGVTSIKLKIKRSLLIIITSGPTTWNNR